jgi:hypothetical protein
MNLLCMRRSQLEMLGNQSVCVDRELDRHAHSYRHSYRQTERQTATDRPTDRQTNRQLQTDADRQPDGYTVQSDKHVVRLTGNQTNRPPSCCAMPLVILADAGVPLESRACAVCRKLLRSNSGASDEDSLNE